MTLALSVHDLPAELLLAIFRLVFSSSFSICDKNCMTCRRTHAAHVAWGPTEAFDTANPTLFPYALAAVLPRWRTVLAGVPEYWTRPVFFLDDPPTSDIDLIDFLSYSVELPIEVYITRRSFSFITDNDDSERERERLRAVMDALRPHLSRCQHIFIHVLRSSSLPSLRHDFAGEAPYLTQLKLECEVDDGINHSAHAKPLPPVSFHCPAIYTLLIDGPNFCTIAMNHPEWWSSAFTPLRYLIIRNLTHDTLPFGSALVCLNIQVLPFLRTLSLSNVSFDTTGPPCNHTLSLHMLILTQTSSPFLSHFFRYTFLGDLYSIRIESCTFPPDTATTVDDKNSDINLTAIPIAFSLTLCNITNPSHLITLLRPWVGRRLTLESCPGLDDSVLAMMCSPLHPTPPTAIASCSATAEPENATAQPAPSDQTDTPYHDIYTTHTIPAQFGCPNLSTLYLNNCTNFTPDGIKHLIQVRNEVPDVDAGAVPTGAIQLITVIGPAPKISQAEKEYFDEQEIVKWDSEVIDYFPFI
ncbi:hypothetical protein P691DRAFT_801213 [Macrolepiota fuliginosa MF-IS2]|uniref:F-box domain-containing protein n=1 Tax=Macrolepiota fuliginosa MF-IS2 TaxID=1400762 RepID=A0A9P5XM56_9AGAR|nr:hypothetical protein P691DRAFT_801213 [Macrolepiota fuliginosa MF-IS2]